jgi:arylsulfatase A-like enzyme
LLEQTVVVVTADHGEAFGEHGMYNHNFSVYQELVRVPLILRYPAQVAPGRVSETVSTASVFATLSALAGLGTPPPHAAPSLLAPANRAVAEHVQPHTQPPRGWGMDRRLTALYDGPWKLIRASDGRDLLFDLSADPNEAFDRSDSEPQKMAAMQADLDRWLRAQPIHVPTGAPEPSVAP